MPFRFPSFLICRPYNHPALHLPDPSSTVQHGDRPASKVFDVVSAVGKQDVLDLFYLLIGGRVHVENGMPTQRLLDVDQHVSILVGGDGLNHVGNTRAQAACPLGVFGILENLLTLEKPYIAGGNVGIQQRLHRVLGLLHILERCHDVVFWVNGTRSGEWKYPPLLFPFRRHFGWSHNQYREAAFADETLRDTAHDPTLQSGASMSRHRYQVIAARDVLSLAMLSVFGHADNAIRHILIDHDSPGEGQVERF